MTVDPEERGDGERELWRSRILLALRDAPVDSPELWLLQEIAARTAHRFTPDDRTYIEGVARWHEAARVALAELRDNGLVTAEGGVTLTEVGREAASHAHPRAADGLRGAWKSREAPGAPQRGPLVMPGVIAPPLRDPEAQPKMGFPDATTRRTR